MTVGADQDLGDDSPYVESQFGSGSYDAGQAINGNEQRFVRWSIALTFRMTPLLSTVVPFLPFAFGHCGLGDCGGFRPSCVVDCAQTVREDVEQLLKDTADNKSTKVILRS